MCVISYGTRLQPYVTRSPTHFCVRKARTLMRMRLPVTQGMRFRLAPSSPRMSMGCSHGQGGCKIALKYRTQIASVAGEENDHSGVRGDCKVGRMSLWRRAIRASSSERNSLRLGQELF